MNRTVSRSLVAAGLIAVGLVLRPAVRAEDYPDASANAPAQQTESEQKAQRLTGTVTAVDPASQTITVKGMLFSKTITVDSNASIMIEGNAATLKDLKTGDRVDVTYHTRNDAAVADRITRTESKSSSSESPSRP